MPITDQELSKGINDVSMKLIIWFMRIDSCKGIIFAYLRTGRLFEHVTPFAILLVYIMHFSAHLGIKNEHKSTSGFLCRPVLPRDCYPETARFFAILFITCIFNPLISYKVSLWPTIKNYNRSFPS
jgi:hypothetical protein